MVLLEDDDRKEQNSTHKREKNDDGRKKADASWSMTDDNKRNEMTREYS